MHWPWVVGGGRWRKGQLDPVISLYKKALLCHLPELHLSYHSISREGRSWGGVRGGGGCIEKDVKSGEVWNANIG